MTQRAHFQVSKDGELGQTARARYTARRVDDLLKQEAFQQACAGVKIKATRRQARRWLRQRGLAYTQAQRALRAVTQ